MVINKSLIRHSVFSENDSVILDPDIHGGAWEREQKFFKLQPVKVVEIIVSEQDGNFPSHFRYLVENSEGERIFVDENALRLYSAAHCSKPMFVTENYHIQSDAEVGDKVRVSAGYYTSRGIVVAIKKRETDKSVPYFEYMVEHSDRTRRLYKNVIKEVV